MRTGKNYLHFHEHKIINLYFILPCFQELVIKSTDDEESIQFSALDTLRKKILDVANNGWTDNVLIAIGEYGQDYEREPFFHCAVQRAGFLLHLDVAEQAYFPLFQFNRNMGTDL